MDTSTPTTSSNNAEVAETQHPIIVKPRGAATFRSTFGTRSSLPSFRTINKQIAEKGAFSKSKPSNAPSTHKEIILLDDSVQPESSTKVHPKFAVPSRVVAKPTDITEEVTKTIVPQVIPSGQITRLPIVVQQQKQEEESSCARARSFNGNRLEKKAKKKRVESVELGSNFPTTSADYNPKIAITSEPLLLYYQELINTYKKQVRELQTDIKNYRRREDKLKKQSKGPTMTPICKKTFSESNAKIKRQTVQKLKESIDVLLEGCTPEDKNAALLKAFPETFPDNKLTAEQTWYFERKFKLNNGIMDKYRRFLSEFNLNPFASYRQVTTYKERIARENPGMLHIQPADSGHDDSDSDVEDHIEESGYVPSVLATVRNNDKRTTTAAVVTTTFRDDPLYNSNSSVAAQYGQQVIQQQEQYLRRNNQEQAYVSRQNTQNPQQPFGPSAFLPTTGYNSLYSGHY